MPPKIMTNQNITSHRVPIQWSQNFQFNVSPNSINHKDFSIQLKFQTYQNPPLIGMGQVRLPFKPDPLSTPIEIMATKRFEKGSLSRNKINKGKKKT